MHLETLNVPLLLRQSLCPLATRLILDAENRTKMR